MIHSVSLFAQLLEILEDSGFSRIVHDLGGDKGSKGFSCREQLAAMMFCQLGQAKSLAEITLGMRSCLGKLQHLGMAAAPKKSTLAYANAHRPAEIFEQAFYGLLSVCQAAHPGRRHKFRFANKLLSLDASVIDLCAEMYDWAKYRKTKGAVKLHLLLDHDGYLPVFANISEGRVHEIHVARQLDLPRDAIVAMDRGYTDYELFGKWTDRGVWFVTRKKDNALYEVVENREAPKHRNILCDQVIRLTGAGAAVKCPHPLRRIEAWVPEKNDIMVLLTNNLKLGASTVSAIYRDRWGIESFFKMLKQNLRVKTFVGTSANALHIQLWTALAAILLLKYLQFRSRTEMAFSNLVALVRMNLFTYKNLWRWLDDPFEKPPEPEPRQPMLPFLDSMFGRKAECPA